MVVLQQTVNLFSYELTTLVRIQPCPPFINPAQPKTLGGGKYVLRKKKDTR